MSYDSAENSLTKGLFILFVSFQTELDSLHVKRKEKVMCHIHHWSKLLNEFSPFKQSCILQYKATFFFRGKTNCLNAWWHLRCLDSKFYSLLLSNFVTIFYNNISVLFNLVWRGWQNSGIFFQHNYLKLCLRLFP